MISRNYKETGDWVELCGYGCGPVVLVYRGSVVDVGLNYWYTGSFLLTSHWLRMYRWPIQVKLSDLSLILLPLVSLYGVSEAAVFVCMRVWEVIHHCGVGGWVPCDTHTGDSASTLPQKRLLLFMHIQIKSVLNQYRHPPSVWWVELASTYQVYLIVYTTHHQSITPHTQQLYLFATYPALLRTPLP